MSRLLLWAQVQRAHFSSLSWKKTWAFIPKDKNRLQICKYLKHCILCFKYYLGKRPSLPVISQGWDREII